jgi:Lrp/AsnC family transcriptional regulator for asnA, asnC and gidA
MSTPSKRRLKLDDIDHGLIRLLRQDGRAGNREIGRALGISEGTVRSRIRRLAEGRVVHVTAISDYEAEGYEFWLMCCFQVEGRPVKDVAADIAACPQAVAVSIVTGRYDIVASVLAKDKTDLTRLLAEDLGTIRGVSAIETAVALDVVLSTSEWAAHL